jgi:MFS family permease
VNGGPLWRNRAFQLLWAGQSVSQLGSQVSGLAVPLTAALVLGAGPTEMGVLGAGQTAPWLLIGPFAGVWVDRLPRRPVLIAAELAQAAVLASVPVAALLGRLHLVHLYAVDFATGVAAMFFQLAYQGFLPALVPHDRLIEANGRFETSASAAQVVGPSAAGLLIHVLSAPIAVALDAVSFVVSGAAVAAIRVADRPRPRDEWRPGVRAELAEGVAWLARSPLVPVVGAVVVLNLSSSASRAVYVLFATRDLGLDPAALGLVYGLGSVGGLIGALAAARVVARLGVGPSLTTSALVGGLARLLAPAAVVGGPLAAPVLAASQFLNALPTPLFNVVSSGLRQATTPDHLQGRVVASIRVLVLGCMTLGSLAGGFLGDAIGVWPTLLLAALGALPAFLWTALTPIGRLDAMPAAPHPDGGG